MCACMYTPTYTTLLPDFILLSMGFSAMPRGLAKEGGSVAGRCSPLLPGSRAKIPDVLQQVCGAEHAEPRLRKIFRSSGLPGAKAFLLGSPAGARKDKQAGHIGRRPRPDTWSAEAADGKNKKCFAPGEQALWSEEPEPGNTSRFQSCCDTVLSISRLGPAQKLFPAGSCREFRPPRSQKLCCWEHTIGSCGGAPSKSSTHCATVSGQP